MEDTIKIVYNDVDDIRTTLEAELWGDKKDTPDVLADIFGKVMEDIGVAKPDVVRKMLESWNVKYTIETDDE